MIKSIYKNCNYGSLIIEDHPPSFSVPFIMMTKGKPIDYQIFVFFHEYAHYKCYRDKCSCRGDGESHAWKNSLELMLHYKCYRSIVIALKVIDSYKDYDGPLQNIKGIYNNITKYNGRPSYRKAKKWVKNCPKKYKNSLIRID